MSDALKRMQSIVAKFKTSKDSSEQIVALLEEAVNIVLDLPNIRNTKDVFQYFCKEFTLTLFSSVLKLDYRNITKSLLRLYEEYATIFCSEIKFDNSLLAYSLVQVFDPKEMLYSSAFADSIILQVDLPHSDEWKAGLKVGDLIEALYVEKEENICMYGWRRCEIISRENEIIHVKLLNTNITTSYNINNKEIAPQGTRITDDSLAWRANLKRGDVVDCFDTIGCWYESTILDIEEREYGDCPIIEFKIGYRVYCEDGAKFEPNEPNLKYEGWSSTYDRVINAYSSKLQPRNSHCRKGKYELKKLFDDDRYEEESSDLLKWNTKKQYALKRNSCTSALYILLLNKLGEGEFFETVPKLIEQQISVETIHSLLIIMESISKYIHKSLSLQIATNLFNALVQYFSKFSEPIIRSFKKEFSDQIFKTLEAYLRREYTPITRNLMILDLLLKVSTVLMKSELIEKRIQSLKSINETVLDKMPTEKVLTLKEYKQKLIDWIDTNNIFDEIFGKRGHLQLIQRSAQIIRLYYKMNEKLPLDIIWDQISDPHTKVEIYSCLKSCISFFNSETAESIIFKILDYNKVTGIKLDDLDFIVEIFNIKYEVKNSNRIVEMILTLICNQKYRHYSEKPLKPKISYLANTARWSQE